MLVQRVKPRINESALENSALKEALLPKTVCYLVTLASSITITVICYVTPCSLINGPKLHGVTYLNIYVKVILWSNSPTPPHPATRISIRLDTDNKNPTYRVLFQRSAVHRQYVLLSPANIKAPIITTLISRRIKAFRRSIVTGPYTGAGPHQIINLKARAVETECFRHVALNGVQARRY